MRAFESIRTLLFASDNSKWLKQKKKKKKSDYFGSCHYKSQECSRFRHGCIQQCYQDLVPLCLLTLGSVMLPPFVPGSHSGGLAKSVEGELLSPKISNQSPWVESHWLGLDHVSILEPITIFRYSYTNWPGLGHMTT